MSLPDIIRWKILIAWQCKFSSSFKTNFQCWFMNNWSRPCVKIQNVKLLLWLLLTGYRHYRHYYYRIWSFENKFQWSINSANTFGIPGHVESFPRKLKNSFCCRKICLIWPHSGKINHTWAWTKQLHASFTYRNEKF